MTIYFYIAREEYGEFSNFSPHGVTLDGQYYPTSEHYFQAQKYACVNSARAEQIRRASSPKQAAELGRDRKYALRPDWETVKESVMLAALRAKFSQHPALCELLLATSDEALVENAPGDYYWGCGADGTGKNRLGFLLEIVRAELRS